MNAVTLRPARAPSALLMLAEFRALWEAGATLAVWPVLKLAPRGDGHPVLVLPGLTSGDASTLLLRRYLKGRGYDVHGWGQGRRDAENWIVWRIAPARHVFTGACSRVH